MKQYESYKDSGIEWLGKIPSHWNTVHIKNYFNVISGATPDSSNDKYWDGDIIWITPADFKTSDHFVSTGKRNITAEGYKSCGTTMVPAGSLIFSKRAPIGTVAISSNALCTNQGCLSCVPFEKVCFSPYYYYLFSVLTEAFEMLGSGSTFLEISAANFSNFPISAPSFEEQQSIAAYLDYKVGQIDAVIAEKEQMLEDLKAYRSAIISEAVTKGLNKNVEMKDSRIEWLGSIPAHWKTSKLKYTGSFENGLTYSPDDIVEEGILVLRASNIQNSHFSFEDCVYVKEVPSELFVKDGDIIICSRNGSANLVGKCAYVDHIDNASFGAFMMRYRPSLYSKFAFYAFQTVTAFYKGLYSTSTINQLTKSVINQMFMAIPPLKEQMQIANYIDNKIAFIDSSINEIQSQIDDFKSYKSSIITEAVTGKVDLREWKLNHVNS